MSYGTLTEPQRALADHMSELSEYSYCAGWMSGIEEALWEIMNDPAGELRQRYGMAVFTDYQLERLRELSDACGGWIYWKGDVGPDDGEAFITTADWLARIQASPAATAHSEHEVDPSPGHPREH